MYVLFAEDTLKIIQTGDTPKAVGAGLVVGELFRDAAPVYNVATQKIIQTSTREGDNLRLGWSVVSLSQAELDAKAVAAAAAQATTDAKAEVAKVSEEIDKARDLTELKAVITKQFSAIKTLLSVK